MSPRFPSSRIALVVLAVLFVSGALTAQSPAEDPWAGKSRSEIETLLGEPNKTKKSADGAATLVYKLLRIDESAPPAMGLRLLQLPGVGLVGLPARLGSPHRDAVTIEPAGYDDRGRPQAGGVQSSASSSWSTGEGLTQTFAGQDSNEGIRGKVTVKFEVDAAGVIRSWSHSGKKK